MAAIEALPLVQTPEVFGLHANADISYYTSATKALWRNLVCCVHMCFSAMPCLCLINSIMQLKSCYHVDAVEHARAGLCMQKCYVEPDTVSTANSSAQLKIRSMSC